MRLIVGLGNPGRRYADTRHNVGYAVVANLVAAGRLGPPRLQSGCQLWRAEGLLLATPASFMNLSGAPVGALVHFFRVPVANLLVVHDELDLPLGILRFKAGGGHGGHNGLRSIAQVVGADFGRLRVGIGRPPAGGAGAADYVLARPAGEEAAALAAAIVAAATAAALWCERGIDAAMAAVHRRHK